MAGRQCVERELSRVNELKSLAGRYVSKPGAGLEIRGRTSYPIRGALEHPVCRMSRRKFWTDLS